MNVLKDWWKSTEKSRLKWELIHNSIKCINNNEIFIWNLEEIMKVMTLLILIMIIGEDLIQ